MARKKYYENHETINEDSTLWKTALYIRLSREDGDKEESDSVVNQRNMLTDYVNEKSDFALIDTYIDDGCTGTNFNRPAFKRMIKDIKTGKINCIIVKDLSRFGRNYIEAGSYLEQLLPFLKCRFVSILDNLDSFYRPQEISSVFVQFKHIMNEHYSNENSQKLRYTFDAQRKEGKLVSAFAPYGYKKDPKDNHHLIMDEEAAGVVRNIFHLVLNDMGVIRIANKLNSLGIVPPGVYRKQKGICKEYHLNRGLWCPNTVRTILGNKVYIGALDQKKYTTRNHKDRKRIFLTEDERIFIPNTHEPIIDEKVFNEVQNRFKRCVRTSPNERKVYLFTGFLRCADCGRAMIRTPKKTKSKLYVYYKCRTYNQISKDECPYSHSIKHEVLEESVLYAIKAQIYAVADMQMVIDKINNTSAVKNIKIDFSREIANTKRMIETKTRLKTGLYEDWKAGNLTRSEFIKMKKDYNDEIERLELSVHEITLEEKAVDDMQTQNTKWMDSFLKHYQINELTRELLLSLVDVIYIDKDKNINIKFQYHDEYKRIIKYVTSNIYESRGAENEQYKFVTATN